MYNIGIPIYKGRSNSMVKRGLIWSISALLILVNKKLRDEQMTKLS